MALRVRALYQNNRPILIFIVALLCVTTLVSCVSVIP